MICTKCKNAGVKNEVLGKEFYYCRVCKEEILLEEKEEIDLDALLLKGMQKAYEDSAWELVKRTFSASTGHITNPTINNSNFRPDPAMLFALTEHQNWLRGIPGSQKLTGISYDMSNIDFTGFTLKGANLRASNFNYSNLENVDLENANLANSTFFNANLKGANLKGTILELSDFDLIKIWKARRW